MEHRDHGQLTMTAKLSSALVVLLGTLSLAAERPPNIVLLLADDLDGYGPFHAARADFCRTLGRRHEAEQAYRRALELATNDPEHRFLESRLREVQDVSIPEAR